MKRRLDSKQPSGQDDTEKEVVWWPASLTSEIKKHWPIAMRKDIGFQLGRVQRGLNPDNYRTMPGVGAGICEIKLQDDDKSQYRLVYIARFEEAIYVIHVITKKTSEKTSTHDKQLIKMRLSEIIEYRRLGKFK